MLDRGRKSFSTLTDKVLYVTRRYLGTYHSNTSRYEKFRTFESIDKKTETMEAFMSIIGYQVLRNNNILIADNVIIT